MVFTGRVGCQMAFAFGGNPMSISPLGPFSQNMDDLRCVSMVIKCEMIHRSDMLSLAP